MRIEDMIMISIDDHLIEPPGMFDRHMPAKYKDQAPQLVHTADGSDRWVFQGNEAGHFALGAVASWPRDEWNMDPGGYADMRPGCYDVDARVRDMDAGGVLASMCFPTFAGFAGNHLARGQDKKLTAIAFSAWNDWHLDEWCGAHPGRFIPLSILPLADPEAMVKEVHRVAAKGSRAVSLPEMPHLLGLPSFYTDYWDPVFQALSDEDLVVCLHIGMAFNSISLPKEAPEHQRVILSPLLCALTATDLFVANVFRRFPQLRVALSEGGIGWIPFYLDKIDRHIENQQWTGLVVDDSGQKSATDVFREHVLACFITDPSTLALRERIGLDNIAWECDFPHSDSTWPTGPEEVFGEMQGAQLSDEEINKITWQNASRFFRFDPFEHSPREESTVGRLRARASDVDVSTTSKHEYRRRYEAAHAAVG